MKRQAPHPLEISGATFLTSGKALVNFVGGSTRPSGDVHGRSIV